jgi:hypothetical protein
MDLRLTMVNWLERLERLERRLLRRILCEELFLGVSNIMNMSMQYRK